MSSIDLLQPLLDGGVKRNNFFNGRLLSAEDLRTEQVATRDQLRDHGRAFGDGVACGFGVEIVARGPANPTVRVAPGLAFNRLGAALRLADPVDLRLVPETTSAEVLAGLFADCEKPRPMAAIGGAAAWVLAASPTSGWRETATVSDPNATAIGRGACGARYNVEGLTFRLSQVPVDQAHGLVPQGIDPSGALEAPLRTRLAALLASTGTPQREQLRNLLAHACYGSGTLAAALSDPLRRYSDAGRSVTDAPVWARWGALDAMRERGDLTDCDVPVTLVVLDAGGIRFVDLWAVRRKPIDAKAVDGWRVPAGGRREAEGEAAFLQFQAQLEAVRAATTAPATLAARDWFDWLPAAGWLPGGTDGFEWRTFLGEHAPAAPTPVDAALLRGVIERSWRDEPFTLATTPPVPLRVYQVPGESAVVFARSQAAQLRIVFTPAPATGQSVAASVRPHIGSAVASDTLAAGRMMIGELPPGRAAVALDAPDFAPVTPGEVDLVGGRTTDLQVALSPIQNGSIAVTAEDKATGADIGAQVDHISATGPQPSTTEHPAERRTNGTWLVRGLPAGTYTLSGSAGGYRAASASGVGPVSSTGRFDFTLDFQRIDTAKPKPERCMSVSSLAKLGAKKLRVCMVLVGMAFEQRAFAKNKPTRTAKASAPNVMFSVPKRHANRPGIEVAADGELLYSAANPPWKGMERVQHLPTGMDRWLQDWAGWFAIAFDDTSIAAVAPLVFVDPNFKPTAAATPVREKPPAWAVFEDFGVPLSIGLIDASTRAPVNIREAGLKGVPSETYDALEASDIRTINDIVWIWEEITADITGDPANVVVATIAEARGLVTAINDGQRYYAGVDEQAHAAMKEAGLTSDEAIAKAGVSTLTEVLGSKAFALRVLQQAKTIVGR